MSDQPPDPSSEQQVARLQGDLGNLVQVLVTGLNDRLSPCEVDSGEFSVLRACFAVGPVSTRDLRKLVPLEPTHMSRLTGQLEDKGLIQKTRRGDDRRLVNLELTENGQSLLPELTRRVEEYYALLLNDTSHEELVGSMAVMEKMIAAAEEGEGGAAASTHSPQSSSDGEEDRPVTADQPRGRSVEVQVPRLERDVMALVNVLFIGIEKRTSPFALNVVEFTVFAACCTNEPVTISGLAQQVPIDAGRISRIVSKLEDRQLVRKARPKEDRRIVRVMMTEEGRAMALQLMGRVGEHYADIVKGVSEEELTGLLAFINKMTANAETGRG